MTGKSFCWSRFALSPLGLQALFHSILCFIDFCASGSSDPITEGKLSVTANGNFFDGLKIELDLSNQAGKKEGNLEVVFESKTFNLKVLADSSRSIEIDLTSDISKLEKILFKVDLSNAGTGFQALFKWGNEARQQIELGYKNEGGDIQLTAKVLQDNHFDITFNAGSGTFDLDSKIAGKEMKASVVLQGTKLNIEATEPFSNNGKLTFEGLKLRVSEILTILEFPRNTLNVFCP